MAEYAQFLKDLFAQRNAGRRARLAEEIAVMRELPARRMESAKRERVKVDSGSLIHVERNSYSVNSRLIGAQVEARLYLDHVEVWYGQRKVEDLPRLRGRGKHRIDYRHIIEWLVRKPGAFENYRYQEDLFPTSRFRMAYDALRESTPLRAGKEYLKILKLAAETGEVQVDQALRELLAGEEEVGITVEVIGAMLAQLDTIAPVTMVEVALVDLAGFDQLCTEMLAMSAVADVRPALLEHLKDLHLPTVRECYEDTARQAERETLSYEQYLLEVITRECEQRRKSKVQRLLKDSALPLEKSLPNFDLKRLPAKAARQLRTLLDGSFLDRKENVLVFGNPGSGKSHLLTALAQELVVVKERKMHFTKCALLMQDLLAAKRDLRLSREIKRLSRYDGLIIDDLGYLQQSRDDMEVVFTLLAERYERGSVLMTSNLPFSKWEAIFKDAMMTAAAIDRLVHHSVIIELNIPSYRVEHAKKNQQAESQGESG